MWFLGHLTPGSGPEVSRENSSEVRPVTDELGLAGEQLQMSLFASGGVYELGRALASAGPTVTHLLGSVLLGSAVFSTQTEQTDQPW